jgi:hypothetical protein
MFTVVDLRRLSNVTILCIGKENEEIKNRLYDLSHTSPYSIIDSINEIYGY